MEALWVSTSVVAIAEMGDKTQLLSLLLAARYRRSFPIIVGIFLATVLNHLLAAEIGQIAASYIAPGYLKIGLGVSFILIGLWVLVPDKADEDVKMDAGAKSFWAILWTTMLVFFLAEMGDKTQVATVMLAVRYDALLTVVMGSTIGMMLANVPAVFLGDWLSSRLNRLSQIRYLAAVIFIVIGIVTLF
jgi:putative Ca2+/H+ antiporter (TMEM165/GDT1 family)